MLNPTINLDEVEVIIFDKAGNLITSLNEYDKLDYEETLLEISTYPNPEKYEAVSTGSGYIIVDKYPCPFEETILPNGDVGIIYYQSGIKYIH